MNKLKRIAAIIGIALIVSLYLITFISALFVTKFTSALFTASLFSTFAVPVMIYAFILIYKLVHRDDNTVNIDKLKSLDFKDSDDNK